MWLIFILYFVMTIVLRLRKQLYEVVPSWIECLKNNYLNYWRVHNLLSQSSWEKMWNNKCSDLLQPGTDIFRCDLSDFLLTLAFYNCINLENISFNESYNHQGKGKSDDFLLLVLGIWWILLFDWKNLHFTHVQCIKLKICQLKRCTCEVHINLVTLWQLNETRALFLYY